MADTRPGIPLRGKMWYNLFATRGAGKSGTLRGQKGNTAMFLIGNHVSASKGYLAMGKQAAKLGGNTFAFLRATRAAARKTAGRGDAAALRTFLRENGFGTLVAHAPYTLNACGKDEAVRDFCPPRHGRRPCAAGGRAARPILQFSPGSHGPGREKRVCA